MDTMLLMFGFCLSVLGILGSFLPILPGPPLSWLGLLLLYLSPSIENNYWILGISFLFTALVSVADYIIPAKGTKRFGGSKYGIWGTNIGLVVGLFSPIPAGFIIGPFLGAFIGEIIYNSRDHKRALKAATGSFIGFLASTFIKFVFCMGMAGLFLAVVWQNRSVWF